MLSTHIATLLSELEEWLKVEVQKSSDPTLYLYYQLTHALARDRLDKVSFHLQVLDDAQTKV